MKKILFAFAIVAMMAFSFASCNWSNNEQEQTNQEEVVFDSINEFPVAEFTMSDSLFNDGYTYNFGDSLNPKTITMCFDTNGILFNIVNIENFEVYSDTTILPTFTGTEDSTFNYTLPFGMIPSDSTGVKCFKIVADEIVAPVTIKN